MLTRREEDIAEMESDEKNTEILMKWLKGKEGKRDVRGGEQEATQPPSIGQGVAGR